MKKTGLVLMTGLAILFSAKLFSEDLSTNSAAPANADTNAPATSDASATPSTNIASTPDAPVTTDTNAPTAAEIPAAANTNTPPAADALAEGSTNAPAVADTPAPTNTDTPPMVPDAAAATTASTDTKTSAGADASAMADAKASSGLDIPGPTIAFIPPEGSDAAGVTQVALGEYSMFFVVNGRIKVLGSNRADEGGFDKDHGSINIPAKPIMVPANLKFVNVACGGYQTIAVEDTGQVWTWGGNDHGELGIGVVDNDFHIPAPIKTDINGDPFDNVVDVASGFHFFAALKKDGSVWTWGLSGDDKAGYDSTGIVGNGDKTTHNVIRPSKVIFPEGTVITRISAGMNFLMAMDKTGGVWSWGGGKVYESRGTGSRDAATPTKLEKLPSDIKAITAGNGCGYALDSKGNLWGWGYYGGYLGMGDSSDYPRVPLPVKLDFPELNGRVKAVAMSEVTTHALRDDGTLWGWGSSAMGAVGNGTMNDWTKSDPTYTWDWLPYESMVMKPVQVLDGVAAVYGSAQGPYVYAIKKNGEIWSWGRNKTGALGNGIMMSSDTAAKHPDTNDVPTPKRIKPL